MKDKDKNHISAWTILINPHIWYRTLFFLFGVLIILEGFTQPYTMSYKMSTVVTWGIIIAIIPDCYLGIVRFIKWLPNRGSEE